MSEPVPVRGVLVTHGSMAQGMVDAVRRISGVEAEALVAVSNDGKKPEDVGSEIIGVIQDEPAVVFTDLGSGSCTLAARLSCRDRREVVLLTGVNLPMLLDFVFHRTLPLAELAERLAVQGKDGVRLVRPPEADGDSALPR